MSPKAEHPVETTRKSLRLVEALKEADGAGVTELADQLDMSKSVVHNHLSTLREEGYVVKRDGDYALSLKFLELGGYTRKQMDLYRVARPEIDQLAEETGELVNLMTENRGLGVYLYRAKGKEAVDLNTYTGCQTYLHSTALGKCILSQIPAERRREIFDEHGLPPATEKTITDPDRLEERLEQVQEQGYAIDDSELLEGLRCVAAPIIGEDGVIGAISISIPAGRLPIEKARTEMTERVQNIANVIEVQVRY